MTNYQEICLDLISNLPQRQKEVILRRFALRNNERETLESIGQGFGITRERVRQIEEDGLTEIKQKAVKYQKIFKDFDQYFKNSGGLKKEDILLEDLGKKKYQAQIYFLLTIAGKFERAGETENIHSLWLADKNALDSAKEAIDFLSGKLKEIKKPLNLNEISSFSDVKKQFLFSYLEISKIIQKNSEGLFGLRSWPEINPRGVKDKAYLILKKKGEPLHFAQVANLIENANLQTVHNELIRDSRFVLVGRGIYALKDWGYQPGQVKDVILKVLKERGPLPKEEILGEVLKQRQVKENTILLNLSNKDYFLRDSQGKYYTVNEA